MSGTTKLTYLGPREGSRYEQYFFRGRNLRAEMLYRATVGSEPITVEEVARDYDVPVSALLEAIQYAAENSALLRREREEDLEESHTRGIVGPSPLTPRS